MDYIKSFLPPGNGVLPYYMLILSLISIGNSLQAYTTLHFSRRVYNGLFVPNPRLPRPTPQSDPQDRVDKLIPATATATATATDQLTPLAARLFGTWTLITSVVRCYAAYNLRFGPVYSIAVWTYVVALAHFASELFVFRTMSPGVPQVFPFCLATAALVWMPMVRDFYVEVN